VLREVPRRDLVRRLHHRRAVVTTGFAAVPNWLVEEPTVTAHEKLVYLVLSSKIGDQGAWFIGHSTIADMAGISVSSVQRALILLNERGVVTWQERRDEATGARLGNSYRLMTDRLGQGDRPPQSERLTPSVSVTEQNKNPEKEPINTSSETDALVEELRAIWPVSRRATRKTVAKAIQAALKVDAWHPIITAARAHAKVWASWPKGDLQYVPLITTWLNQERWTGAAPEVRAPQRGATPARTAPPGVHQNDAWMYR